MRVPRHNNVYGQLVSFDGLRPLLAAIEAALGPGTASVYRPGRDRAETIRVRTDTADLESIPMPGGIDYMLNGAVAGSPDDVVAFVRALSAALTSAGVEHSFEMHDPVTRFRASVP